VPDAALESLTDSDSEIAEPAVIEDNVIYTIQRMNEHARVFRALFKKSTFDREAEERIGSLRPMPLKSACGPSAAWAR